jgi:predicted ester cyclase
MSIEEENKKIIRLVFEELGKGNLEVIDEYFSEDFKRYASDGQEMDKDGYKQFGKMLLNRFTDFHITIEDMVAEGDKLAFRFTWTGKDNSDIMDGSLKGKSFSITEDYFCLIKDGKILEFKNLHDRLSRFKQAGIAPPIGEDKK